MYPAVLKQAPACILPPTLATPDQQHVSRRVFERRFHFLSLERSPMQLLWSFLRKASTFERSRRCSLRVLASPLVGTVQDGLGGWRYLIRDNCAAVRLVGSVDSARLRIFGPQVRLGVHLACDAPRSRTCTLFGCLRRSWHVEMCPSQASCWRACRGVRSLSRSPKLWTTSARL